MSIKAQPFVPPKLDAKAFNCPLCHAYAAQHWSGVWAKGGATSNFLDGWRRSTCTHCLDSLMWCNGRIVEPEVSAAPPPNADFSSEIKSDYAEAAAIAMRSPRGAAALLRLAIQKLCRDLGERGDNLNADIGALVAKGLPPPIQQALDAVRVIGNEAVHPGELDLRDDVETVGRLFRLINAIAEHMITRPKEIAALYDMIPPEKREQIEKRNAAALERPRKALAGPTAPASTKTGA